MCEASAIANLTFEALPAASTNIYVICRTLYPGPPLRG
jgi:hypothetical protein